MRIVSIRENQDYKEQAIEYIKKHWAQETTEMIYKDCIENSLKAESPLPQWYLLMENESVVGCAGLITNDFISRMELYPWLCCLYIEEDMRGYGAGNQLMERIKEDTEKFGFENLYLCTDLRGYYERYGFKYLAKGYHPWGEETRIYKYPVSKNRVSV